MVIPSYSQKKNIFFSLIQIPFKRFDVNLIAITAYMPSTALGCANARSKPGYICLDERFDRTNPHNAQWEKSLGADVQDINTLSIQKPLIYYINIVL